MRRTLPYFKDTHCIWENEEFEFIIIESRADTTFEMTHDRRHSNSIESELSKCLFDDSESQNLEQFFILMVIIS